jgi:sterol 3beta-glucosyltransferase
MKPITLLTSGTRGDVQPMIALALGLRKAGLPVKIAAPPNFGDWVRSFGIPFTSVEGNPSELMIARGGQSALTYDGSILRSLRVSLNYVQQARPIYTSMLSSATEACRDASALVIGLPTVWGIHIAEAFGIPCIGAFTQPVTPTGDFPSPLIPSTLSLGRVYNLLTYRLASHATFLPWRSIINDFRKKCGLKPLVFFDFINELDSILYGFSKHVVPAPADWHHNEMITGYWPLDTDNFVVPESLKIFLSSEEPLIYFSFGSPGTRNPEATLLIIIQAVEEIGGRAVIALPQNIASINLPPFFFPLSFPVSHHWLFPQMSGIVHHGGAGTTAAALMAGVPSLAMPLAVDQFFWGKRVEMLGVGARPIPQRDLSVARLIEGLKKLQDDGIKERAMMLAGKLKDEKGVESAVTLIRQRLGM